MKNFLGRWLILVVLMGAAFTPKAQHQELNEDPNIWGNQSERIEDTKALIDVFRKGVLHGHYRYFFMATDNAPGFQDYFANAAGGGIRFETGRFHGFHLVVSGFYTFNIWSSDLSIPDPLSGNRNRYEIGLFDVEDPENVTNLDRLEEFHLGYEYRNTRITLGKQLLNTPFLNLQDGRMRPTAFDGLYFSSRNLKKWSLQGGVLTGVAPRGTMRYMGIGESVGVFPVGVGIDGTPNQYRGFTVSNFIGVLGAFYAPRKTLIFQFWDVYADQLMNTSMVQLDWTFAERDQNHFYLGLQSVQQFRVGNGGHPLAGNRYFNQNQAFTFGSRLGLRRGRWNTNLNFNRITGHGQYLMPREWGRDPFYTFMPRERNEGFGDVNAYVGRVSYDHKQKRLKTGIGLGYFDMPSVKNHRLNKYGVPGFVQFNADLMYAFSGFWQGLEMHFLLASKFKTDADIQEPRYIVNKVDVFNYNLVVNYRF
jgi:hypothetical protein